uniref:S26 family signal peptidase n=1 Tax=Escherichia ruysiae TaxID=2608867 RepID=UPI00215A7306
PRLIWNASASVPLGLYAVQPVGDLTLGDLVAVSPPEPLAQFITARGYVGPGVPLLKRVTALPGTRVCRTGTTITVHG